MHRTLTALAVLAAALLLALPASAQASVVSFERSVHDGPTTGVGTLAGVEYVDLTGATATLSFDWAEMEQVWVNQTFNGPTGRIGGSSYPPPATETYGFAEHGSARLYAAGPEAFLMVFPQSRMEWGLEAQEGILSAPPAAEDEVTDNNPIIRTGGSHSFPLTDATVWSSSGDSREVLRGDFHVSLFDWTLQFSDGRSFTTGASTTADVQVAAMENLSSAWLHLKNATLTVEAFGGAVRNSYVTAPVLTTEGTTRLEGLPGAAPRVYEGTTTLSVSSAGDGIQATVREGGSASASSPATTALAVPADSPWLWGGVAATLFVAAFVFVALAARSTPMLEWRSYHALDRHRPVLAAFWANLWTRRDPWDGHAWSARGEARMMMRHDRGAARDFTKAHSLLPPEERAVNALHAARSHARMGHATQTAHWIGIVACLDLNVLLTAREEPDFARVWDHASVQRAVQQVLGVGA